MTLCAQGQACDTKMIAAGLGLEPAVTRWPGAAVGGNPVPKSSRVAHKPTLMFGRIIAGVRPFSVNQQSHEIPNKV